MHIILVVEKCWELEIYSIRAIRVGRVATTSILHFEHDNLQHNDTQQDPSVARTPLWCCSGRVSECGPNPQTASSTLKAPRMAGVWVASPDNVKYDLEK